MYIPVNPNKDQLIWQLVAKSLSEEKHVHIIVNGTYNSNASREIMQKSEIENLISLLKALPYVRIGTNRLLPLPPHFGAKLTQNNQKAHLIEYVSINNEPAKIINNLTFIVDFLFFEIKELKELTIPLDCSEITSPNISTTFNLERLCTVFNRE